MVNPRRGDRRAVHFPPASGIAAAVLHRAMYTWNPGVNGIDPIANYANLVTFCTTYHVDHVYLDMYTYLGSSNYTTAHVNAVATCISALKAAGVKKVFALSGDPSWTSTGASFAHNSIIANIATYNAAVATNAQFDGAHFDCEYWTDSGQTATSALPGMANLAAWCRNAGLREVGCFGVFYLADSTGTRPSVLYNGKTQQDGKHLLDIFDHVVVGAYRNVATGGANGNIEGLVSAWNTYATANSRKFYAGVETESASPTYTSFFGGSKATMEGQLALVNASFTNLTSYVGVAVHDYSGWSGLS